MKAAEEIKVRIFGMPRWNGILAEQLRAVGVNAFVSRPLAHTHGNRLLHRAHEILGLQVEHALYPSVPTRFERFAWMMGTRVVYHWIGSDVYKLAQMPEARRNRTVSQLKEVASAFLADSPELAEELHEMGVEAEVVRLLPLQLWGRPMPLPETFRVLNYWGQKPELYRCNVVFALAEQFPHVPFWVVGTDGASITAPPNVRFFGNVDMEDIYRQTSVLLRLPVHDSLSVMVLEAMGRGRYVIYSKPSPHSLFADDLASAQKALLEVMEHKTMNADGVHYVRSHYNPADEADKALKVYQRLLN